MGDGKINGWLDRFCMNRLVGGWRELYGLREKAVEFSQRLESMHTHSQYSTTQNALSLANYLTLACPSISLTPKIRMCFTHKIVYCCSTADWPCSRYLSMPQFPPK